MSSNGWWDPQNMGTGNWNPSHTFTNFQSQQNQDPINYEIPIPHQAVSQHHCHSIPLNDHQPYSQIFASTSPTSSVMAAYHHHLNKSFTSTNINIIFK